MRLHRSKSVIVVVWLGLLGLSLRPLPALERAVELAFEPVRLLARPARLFGAWSGSTTAAAGPELERARTELRAVLAAEERRARPAAPALVEGRGLVSAQVVDRNPATPDLVTVRHAHGARPALGDPVVCGEVYVGTVVELAAGATAGATAAAGRLRPGEARVELVTAREHRVGARSESGAALVAGGLAQVAGGAGGAGARARTRLLAVRAPERELVEGGEVRVAEQPGSAAALATGYRLGRLVVRPGPPRQSFALEPALDYRNALSQLYLLCPPERAGGGAALAQDPLDRSAWLRTSFVLAGAPSPVRATRLVGAGTRHGVLQGAAVASGTELVGRVARAGPLTSTVELFGERGFELLVLAVPSGREPLAPVALGRFTCLGHERASGRVRVHWLAGPETARALEAPEPLLCELYSAAGERGVPPGLYIGRARLPARAGEHELEVELDPARFLRTEIALWNGPGAAEERP